MLINKKGTKNEIVQDNNFDNINFNAFIEYMGASGYESKQREKGPIFSY